MPSGNVSAICLKFDCLSNLLMTLGLLDGFVVYSIESTYTGKASFNCLSLDFCLKHMHYLFVLLILFHGVTCLKELAGRCSEESLSEPESGCLVGMIVAVSLHTSISHLTHAESGAS